VSIDVKDAPARSTNDAGVTGACEFAGGPNRARHTAGSAAGDTRVTDGAARTLPSMTTWKLSPGGPATFAAQSRKSV